METIKTHPPLSLLLLLQSAPPQETFKAFKDDCEVLGMPWYSSTAQQLCVSLFIRNPILLKYPPRKTNIRAFLKLYLNDLQSPETMTLMINTLNHDDEEEEDTIDSRLMEAYIEYSINSDSNDIQATKCYKTFYCPFACKPYLPVRLASGQFTNVGLALWPAAFVLTQLLLDEFTSSQPMILSPTGKIRVLELGAGVGLTPLVLHRYSPCRERLQRCILTDYQPELIENILFNLNSNGIVSDLSSDHKGKDLVYITDILDWTETEENQHKLQEWDCNLILAADCIYEVELITPLVTTLRNALHSAEDAVAIVVQTHRQNTTMRRFFDAVKDASLQMKSFRLLSNALDEKNERREGGGLTLQPATLDAEGNLITIEVDQEQNPDNNNNNNNNRINTRKDNGEGNNGCWNGWLGPFYLSSEAAVGIHVLRR
ncbi:uncharacterized protein TM35_000242420 [Trypanosoma theileri]|uniref:Methyltransferase n=1 Tax=Trypanosoma theileri TaxID=67003 RepID=A0A1X0NQU9_9TRYP|nr:uncharacterized protein TM35_000242420 [Trypanosoma theileri]ORC87092.1 hypothetical protein TM35_000242420 [Trypanosoma theileri]